MSRTVSGSEKVEGLSSEEGVRRVELHRQGTRKASTSFPLSLSVAWQVHPAEEESGFSIAIFNDLVLVHDTYYTRTCGCSAAE
ncbi:hypothetical protein AVEN_49158-1 [Araneus ventricosus]|uniref:Uncharacterized protein n=1 Tax=Araneus ventricosus TaxID=182803 RepID=A0A4Y2C215_ARAVE|nr:hypothetical protein AVEN_49158-1 [Araneus ventricosus]